MGIVDIYKSSLVSLLDLEFPVFKRLEAQPGFTQFTSPRSLVESGKLTGNCLLREEKIKYYIHQILNNGWNVFSASSDQVLLTIDRDCRLIETEIVSGTPDINKIKQILRQYKDIKIKKVVNKVLLNSIKRYNNWVLYEFKGIREGREYCEKKIVIKSKTKAGYNLIITTPDQANNIFHNIIKLTSLEKNLYISTDTFDSHDDCFRLYYITGDTITTRDVNGDKIVTFDVAGSRIK